jgi:uncharacterized membrane protein
VLHLIVTIAILTGCIGLAVYGSWKAGQPWDESNPRIVPWRLVMVLSVFAGILALVHLINLAGLETGPEHSIFGRF